MRAPTWPIVYLRMFVDRTFNWHVELRLLSAFSPVLFKQVQGNPYLLFRALSSVLLNSVAATFIWYDHSGAVGERATKGTWRLALKIHESQDGGGRRWTARPRVGCTHIGSCRRKEGRISRYSIRSREISYGEDISASSRMIEIDGGGLNMQGTQTVSIC